MEHHHCHLTDNIGCMTVTLSETRAAEDKARKAFLFSVEITRDDHMVSTHSHMTDPPLILTHLPPTHPVRADMAPPFHDHLPRVISTFHPLPFDVRLFFPLE